MDVQNKHVLVVGLARSGLSVAHALARRGAVVTVTDRRPPAEFREMLPELLQEKVGLELGAQRLETFLRPDLIVISPGVPWDLPQLQAARQRQIPVYPEVEAASWFLEGTLVGITGSNGKTTTTSLLGDMLKASGFPTFVGGNIGNALSSAVDHAQPGTKYVTELSSFQLEGIHDFRPHVAVMLNLSPNHLDRHPSLDAYAQAKRQIFRNQRDQDYAVLNADDPWVAGLRETVTSRALFFSRHRELGSGVFVSGNRVYYRVRHLERVLFETRDVTLRGDFNLEDVLAATTAACVLGADFTAIRKAVRAFQAVEHRLEFVRQIQGVDFYNNSKATSVDATLKSIEAFERGVHLIMGGKDKGAPYTPLLPLIKERVREVLLIGAAAPVIATQFAGQAELVQAGDISTAVYEAFARARPGDTVLLAPACSSFDQFKDYEERGRAFKELVKRLAKDVEAGRVVRSPEPEVRGPKSEVRGPESGISNLEVRDLESGILNLESAMRSPGAGAVTPLMSKEDDHVAQTPLLDKEGCPEGGVVEPEKSAEAPNAQAETGLSPAVPSQPESAAPVTADEGVPAEHYGGSTRLSPGGDESGSSAAALQSASRMAIGGAPPQSAESEPLTEPGSEAQAETHPSLVAPSQPEPMLSAPAEGAASALHHVKLTYVYEVDAVDMPASESQVEPPDEPEVYISANTLETLDDEVLPFEARERKSEVRSPKSEVESTQSEVRSPKSAVESTQSEVRGPRSEVQSTESVVRSPESEVKGTDTGAQTSPKQPRLFNGSDE